MADNNVEIEIKIPINKEEFSELKEKLSTDCTFAGSSAQSDDYYTPAHKNFASEKFPFEWFRIRKFGDNSLLTYKHYYPERAEINTHCDEFETKILDAEQFEKILSALNFSKLVTVNKKRDLFKHEDLFEVVLDTVEGLGYFIEIEALKDFGSVESARKKLFEYAEQLGLDVSKADKRGYPYLMMKNFR